MTKLTKTKEEYLKKLKDPRWQKKRLEILSRDNFQCQQCFDKETTLHVHHREYLGNINPWEYSNAHLITLCETCHEIETENMKEEISNLVQMLKINFFSDGINTLAVGLSSIVDLDIHWKKIIVDALEWAFISRNIFHLIEMYFQDVPNTLKRAKEIPLNYILDENDQIDNKKFKKLNEMLDDPDIIDHVKNRLKDKSHGSEIPRDNIRSDGVRKAKDYLP